MIAQDPVASAMAMAFTGSPLDRADLVRSNPAMLAELAQRDSARLLQLDGLAPLLDGAGKLTWSPLDTPPDGAELVFLGLADGAPLFATVPADGNLDLPHTQADIWQAIARLPADDLAIYGGARSLVDWHARHRFCGRCGHGTHLTKGGWQRDCAGCDAQIYPRVDPVAIMLVEHADCLLLGRQARFPPGVFSALAGFVEPGESIEEAVAREVFEEAGVRVREVAYIASQPWPFPSQLMIGCYSVAESRALVIDETEIEDARWFTRAQVREAVEGGRESVGFVAPPARAIAYHLLHWWVGRG